MGLGVQGLGSVMGLGVQGLGSKMLAFRVWSSGFRIQNTGFENLW